MLFKSKKLSEELPLEILSKNSAIEFKEAYNKLASNVIYLPLESECKKIAVTSANYGEGKTASAINLSIALAQNLIDKKVLLIDADMRLSKVGEFIGELSSVSETGLSDALANSGASFSVVKTGIENLDVIFAGSKLDNPSGLINSDRMKSFLSSLDGEYDYVIIDTPPLNVVSDAILLIGHIDGYILSTRIKHSKVTAIDAATDVLEGVGAKVFGFIVSDVK